MRFVGLAIFVPLALAASPSEKLEPANLQSNSDRTPSAKTWKIADQSCAASNCHGSFSAFPEGRGGHEASVWQSYDPHARAYEVLKSDLAKEMMTILSEHKGGWAKEATKEVRCLACHSSAAADRPTKADDFGDDGVSCRSCHGEASKWLASHTKAGLGLKTQAVDRQAAYAAHDGLRFLGDPKSRAETCTGCHVGAKEGVDGLPRREVDHDLIAAGHPRLNFELASQSTRQPRHWKDRPKTDLAAEWAAGQTAAIKALADLASSREGGPRLDFADQSCAACHQPFPDYRVQGPNGGRKLGRLDWAAPYAASAAWLSNGEALLAAMKSVEQSKPPELAAALQRLTTAAAENPPFNKTALPNATANFPATRDALLAEYLAQWAVDSESERVKKLKERLEAPSR